MGYVSHKMRLAANKMAIVILLKRLNLFAEIVPGEM